MTESKPESLAERLESYAKLLICGEMVDDLRAVVRLITDLKTDLLAANFRCVQLGVQLAKAKEDNELLAACNESMAKSTSALWRILAPEYEGDSSIQEMASVLMKALANALKDSRRLDWLEEDMKRGRDDLQITYQYHDLKLTCLKWPKDESRTFGCPDIRAAIDATRVEP